MYQASPATHLPARQDLRVINSLLEFIQTYDLLLALILQHGISVIDGDMARGLSETETYIAKVKRNAGSM